MITNVPVPELQLGMFITIPTSWLDHPFLLRSFQITSPEQIEKLRHAGIEVVQVDFAKSKPIVHLDGVPHRPVVAPTPSRPAATPLSPESFRRMVRDPGLGEKSPRNGTLHAGCDGYPWLQRSSAVSQTPHVPARKRRLLTHA